METVDLVAAVEATTDIVVAEAAIQDAITERSEDSNETVIELEQINSDTQVEIAQINADAAVAIAETDEVDGEWLQSQLSALEEGHVNLLLAFRQMEERLMEALSTIAAGMLSPQSILTPPLDTPPIAQEPIAPEPIAPESVVAEGQAERPKRIRRLL